MFHPISVGWDGLIKVADNDAKKTVLLVDWPEGCETPGPCPGLVLRRSKIRIDGLPPDSPGSAGKYVLCVAQVLDEAALPVRPVVRESLRPDTRQRGLPTDNPECCPVGSRESGGQLGRVQCPLAGASRDKSTRGRIGVACQGGFPSGGGVAKSLPGCRRRHVVALARVGPRVQDLRQLGAASPTLRAAVRQPMIRSVLMRIACLPACRVGSGCGWGWCGLVAMRSCLQNLLVARYRRDPC